MMVREHRTISWAFFAVLLVGIQFGCRKEAAQTENSEETAKLQAILAKADAADGTVDHTVSKCLSCALLMDGSDKYAADAHGYKLHFCSDDCRKDFEKSISESLLALKIP